MLCCIHVMGTWIEIPPALQGYKQRSCNTLGSIVPDLISKSMPQLQRPPMLAGSQGGHVAGDTHATSSQLSLSGMGDR